MPGIWSELKRRNVIRAGIGYAAIGWLIIEVASVVFPTFHAPEWVLQVLIILVVFGFPVAMILAWVFEVTPDGVIRTGDAVSAQPVSTRTRRRLNSVIVAALVMTVAVLVGQRVLDSRSPGNASANDKVSIAVLPFVNLSSDPEQEFFSDGLTEELMNRLSRIPALRVPARSSSFHFKGNTDLQAVKRGLGVSSVLQGSVRKSGTALRITAELTDVDSGYNLWTESYDRQLNDIFAVQDDITTQIVAALKIRLSEPLTQRASAEPVDTELYQLMLRGRYHWNQRTPEGFTRAIELFSQAVDEHPNYGPAYAGLADVYLSQFDYGLIPWGESTEKARIAATTALELDNSLADAHTSLAHLHLHEWRWQLAEQEFLRAIDLNPGYIVARHWYALCLTATGRVDEAVAAMQQAQSLDPLSVRINADLGMAYLAAGRYEDAVQQEARTLELDPDSATPKWIRGMALEQMGQFEDAERDFRVVLDAWERDASILGTLGHLLAISGQQGSARELLEELEAQAGTTDVTFFAALIDVGLGETDAAFDWLDRAVEERSGSARYLIVDARLDPLRDDPRFAALLAQVGLGPAT
jgi:adenylate cyclase